MSSLVDFLNEHTPLSPPFGGLVVVLALFGLAWLVSRGAGRLATFFVLHGERKHGHGGPGNRCCPDHPDAKLIRRVSYVCSVCHQEVGRDADEDTESADKA